MKSFYIKKASGEKELFSIEKFKRSLRRAGAPDDIIMKIAHKITQTPRLRTTNQIYKFAMKELARENPVFAASYNLKEALIQLGPSGYPFEKFVARIFDAQGYKTSLNPIVPGHCVEHELDLIAVKGDQCLMVECKFHNRRKFKSDVKVSLYVRARFEDLESAWKNDKTHTCKFNNVWIATNTKFTSQAIDYAKCVSINLLDWRLPRGASLPLLVQKHEIYPLTMLTSLSSMQKKTLIRQGVVMCRELAKNSQALKLIGLTVSKSEKVLREAKDLCKLKFGSSV